MTSLALFTRVLLYKQSEHGSNFDDSRYSPRNPNRVTPGSGSANSQSMTASSRVHVTAQSSDTPREWSDATAGVVHVTAQSSDPPWEWSDATMQQRQPYR
jgi:hypothetical protein